ncbi:MAG: hypothetical protein ABEJ00_00650, partial [Gemmatimonadota bacterium]
MATAPGRAGLAVVRVSGPEAREVGRRLGLGELEPRRATTAELVAPDGGETLDRVVATLFPGPDSYTGVTGPNASCSRAVLPASR